MNIRRAGSMAILLAAAVFQFPLVLADTPSTKLTAEERARLFWTAIKLGKAPSFPDSGYEVPLQFPADFHVPFTSGWADLGGIRLRSEDRDYAFVEAPLPDLRKACAAKNLNQLLSALLPGRYDTKATRDFMRGSTANDATLAISAPMRIDLDVVYAHGGRLIGICFHMAYFGSYDPPAVKHTADTPFLDFWATQWTSSDIDAKYRWLDDFQKRQKAR